MRYRLTGVESIPRELEGKVETNGLTYLTLPPQIDIDFEESDKEEVDRVLQELDIKFTPVAKPRMEWYFRCSRCYYSSQEEKEYTLLTVPKKSKTFRLCFDCYRKFVNFMDTISMDNCDFSSHPSGF